jgi:hypothetical protein
MTRAWGNRRIAGWAWLLIAAVLLLRAAVPQGFMPERAVDGSITLTICGSGGVVHIPLKKDAPKPKKDTAPSHCAFAGIGVADLPPPLVLPVLVWTAPAFVERHETAQRTAALYPRPPSRGPPPQT